MATLKELNAKKKELKSTLKRLEGSGATKQQIGRVQYKLNQVMKEKPDRRITKRKTPLADRGPSSGTGKKVAKKKAGPDMYKQAVALDKPKSNVTVTPYKAAKIKDLSANKRAGQVRKDASPSGAAASRKLYEKKKADIATLKDTMKRMKASGSSAAALSTIKAKIAKLQA
jgi:hypothetical protein